MKNLPIYDVVPFRGVDGDYYWRIKAPNGKAISDGCQGYASRSGVYRAARRLIRIGAERRLRLKLTE